jgi:hypothetical protein
MTDLVYNRHGQLVRQSKPREIVPPIIRFFDSIEEIDFGLSAPCWLWRSKRNGEPMLRIDEWTRKRPWRYAFELFHSAFVPSGANWHWLCVNENLCCQPEHLQMIGIYCKTRPLKD